MYTTIEEVFETPLWNVQDQSYWCKMAGYGYPTSRMQEKYAWIIDNGKCDTFEQEYQEYLANQSA